MSETDIKQLAAAYVKAQSQIQRAKKSADNPYFHTKYADLSDVWDACQDALRENKLSVMQAPGQLRSDPLSMELVTVLLHESGESMSFTAQVPLVKADPQSMGSAITYARRFALAALMGVVQEDDDAQKATHDPKSSVQQKASHYARPNAPAVTAGKEFRFSGGKFKDMSFDEIDFVELQGYIDWMKKPDMKEKLRFNQAAIDAFETYKRAKVATSGVKTEKPWRDPSEPPPISDEDIPF